MNRRPFNEPGTGIQNCSAPTTHESISHNINEATDDNTLNEYGGNTEYIVQIKDLITSRIGSPGFNKACEYSKNSINRNKPESPAMRQVMITKEPVTLIGNSAILPRELVKRLEDDRNDELKLQFAKASNPDLCKIIPAPWHQIEGNRYQAVFSWDEEKEPEIVDQDYQTLTDQKLSMDSKITAKLIFVQIGYLLRDKETVGTRLSLKGLQIIHKNGTINDPWED